MGANSAEDTTSMKCYAKHLVKEVELIEGAKLTTEQGHMAAFRFQLIPAACNKPERAM